MDQLFLSLKSQGTFEKVLDVDVDVDGDVDVDDDDHHIYWCSVDQHA